MAARYPRCAVLMWLHGVVRHRYVAAMVRREEESGRVVITSKKVPAPSDSVDIVPKVEDVVDTVVVDSPSVDN